MSKNNNNHEIIHTEDGHKFLWSADYLGWVTYFDDNSTPWPIMKSTLKFARDIVSHRNCRMVFLLDKKVKCEG